MQRSSLGLTPAVFQADAVLAALGERAGQSMALSCGGTGTWASGCQETQPTAADRAQRCPVCDLACWRLKVDTFQHSCPNSSVSALRTTFPAPTPEACHPLPFRYSTFFVSNKHSIDLFLRIIKIIYAHHRKEREKDKEEHLEINNVKGLVYVFQSLSTNSSKHMCISTEF